MVNLYYNFRLLSVGENDTFAPSEGLPVCATAPPAQKFASDCLYWKGVGNTFFFLIHHSWTNCITFPKGGFRMSRDRLTE